MRVAPSIVFLTTIAIAASCYRGRAADPPADPPWRSNFSEVRITGTSPLTVTSIATGEGYTGTLVATDAEITAIGNAVLLGTPLSRAASIDPSGLILVMPIENGRPVGRATLFADVRSPRLSRELSTLSLLSLALAAKIAPRVKLAEATFADGVLDGPASLFAPASSGATAMGPIAEARFANNRLDGVARELVPGTALARREVTFARGVVSGPQREFFASGTLKQEARYRNGAPDGEVIEYYEDGSTFRRSLYVDRAATKISEWFPDGQRRAEHVFGDDGARSKTWYSNGDLKSSRGDGQDEERPANGLILEYHRSGAVSSRTRFADGLKHGDEELFYPSSTRWETGRFERGQRVGVQRKWWKNGTLALESSWSGGAQEGSHKRWYPDGTRWEEATFAAGVRSGRYRKWWRNGAIAHDYRYKAGKLDGEFRTYYDSGAKWAIGSYVGGKPRGTIRRWFPDGRLGYEMHHEGGRPVGTFRRWYANGQPRLVAHYVAGRLEGELKNWLEDGTVYELATYRAGKKLTTTLTRPAASK